MPLSAVPLKRQFKNVVKNYTETQRKVREATSNDPWGPSSTLMAEIANETHNVMAFTDIMQIIWRRLQDKNKNWRHVFKSLLLLEYLVKNGSEEVVFQCREHIHTIKTLREFEYSENGKDHGLSVKRTAQSLLLLLQDDERLIEERAKALQTRDRMLKGGFGVPTPPLSSYRESFPRSTRLSHNTDFDSHSPNPVGSSFEIEYGCPQSVGEEELQLQLVLARSKKEHEEEERRRRAEEAKEQAKLQMALEQSRRDEQARLANHLLVSSPNSSTAGSPSAVAMDGLIDLVENSQPAASSGLFNDPWSLPASVSPVKPPVSIEDPFSSGPSSANLIPIEDPWATGPSNVAVSISPWPDQPQTSTFPPIPQTQTTPHQSSNGTNVEDLNGNASVSEKNNEEASAPRQRTPADFLGEHQGLVDLDKLIERTPASNNPFAISPRPSVGSSSANPFLTGPSHKPSLNQLAPATSMTQPAPLPIMGTMAYPTPFPYTGYAVPPTLATPYQSNPWITPSINPTPRQNPTGPNPFY